jgi:galactokinase
VPDALHETTAERAARLRQTAATRLGGGVLPGDVEVVRAPGRVNLIGEHTDYNGGWVLPAAIDLEIWIAFVPVDAPRIELTSLSLDETQVASFDALVPRADRPDGSRSWLDYASGTAWALIEAGVPVRGIRGVVDSNLPVGSGLSSSAALEIASARALLDPSHEPPAPSRVAAIAQRGENFFVGVKGGILDQFSSACGAADRAILLDCRSLESRLVSLPSGVTLVVCDTGSPHRLEASAFNTRRAECEEGVRIVAAHEPGVAQLRDVDAGMLLRWRHEMPEMVARRCEHIVSEDARVGQTVEALESGDLAEVGRLFAESHASLRDLYEVSSPALDAMVEIASAVPGVVGARMTGAGFGGCTVNLVRDGSVPALRDAVLAAYPARTGLTPAVHVVRAVDGAGHVD